MTNRHILGQRAAAEVAPGLWRFAYPPSGRAFGLARRLALRLWLHLLRAELRRRELL